MTNNRHTSRRSFLGSLAILSGGAAFGLPTNDLYDEKSISNLQKQWQNFWKLQGGKPINNSSWLNLNANLSPCRGHFHKVGTVIYFPHAKTLAQPTWIFWGNERNKPSDVIITFFKSEHGNKKILRINRFELEAMNLLFSGTNEQKWMPIRNDVAPFHAFIENAGWELKVKPRITDSQDAEILSMLSKGGATIEKKLFHNIKLS